MAGDLAYLYRRSAFEHLGNRQVKEIAVAQVWEACCTAQRPPRELSVPLSLRIRCKANMHSLPRAGDARAPTAKSRRQPT